MHKKTRRLIEAFLLIVLLLAGCGENAEKNAEKTNTEETEVTGEKTASTTDTGTRQQESKVISADEIIAEAESMHFLSGDADEDALYEGTGLRLGSVAPAFVQTHSLEEFPVYEGDERFFKPISEDYLIGSFQTDQTTLYEFTSEGSLLSLKGRIVYASEEELISANRDKDLKQDVRNDAGYTYHGNVLYYEMGETDLFAAGFYTDKYDLLKIASTGHWDSYLYWFSMPYDPEAFFYDPEGLKSALAEPGEITALRNKLQGNEQQANDEKESDNGQQGTLTEREAEELLRAVMTPSEKSLTEYGQLFSDEFTENKISAYYRTAFRLPEEFECSELTIVLNESGFAYVVLYSYTVPENYEPMDKIENFLFGTPVCFDSVKGKWVLADNDRFFSQYGDDYYRTILTDEAFHAYASGRFYKRYWVPFDKNSPLVCKGIFMGRVTEVYADGNGNLCASLYFSNDSEEAVTVATLDHLVLTCENGVLAELSADIHETVPAHSYRYDTISIPFENLQTSGFSTVLVQTFTYSTGQ